MADPYSDSNEQTTRSVGAGGSEQNELNLEALSPGPLPESIGRFRPLGRLGSGGGGIVYLANDPVLNRRVAVKVPKLNGNLSDFPFLAEARAAARIKHPNVVQIFDVGSWTDGRMFIAMELVSGGSLSARLKRHRLTWQEAATLVAQVASAIDTAHQNRLLHRDLKPSNVLLDEHGNAKVADFGLSLSSDDSLFARSAITGTPAYMSPEQAAGQAEQLTSKTDLWSIGVILYEALTGKRPFSSPSWPELQNQILKTEPVAPRSIKPGIPRSVEAICLACLRKKPEDRPASAKDIADQLRAAVRRSEQAARRRLAIACIALACGGIAIWASRSRPPKTNTVPLPAVRALVDVPKEESKAEVRWPAAEPELLPIKGRVDLLTITPEVWDFDKTDATSIISIDAKARQFSIASPSPGIFAWPVQLPKRFRWESSLSYSQDGTEIALGWSMHPAIVDNGWNGFESDMVFVKRDELMIFANVGRLRWSGSRGGPLKQLGGQNKEVGRLDGSSAGDTIAVDMEVQDGALFSLRVNGVAVDHPSLPDFDPSPRAVQPVLTVGPGRLTILSSKITALEEAN